MLPFCRSDGVAGLTFALGSTAHRSGNTKGDGLEYFPLTGVYMQRGWVHLKFPASRTLPFDEHV